MVCVFCFFQLIGQKIRISGYILFFVVLFYVMKSFPFLSNYISLNHINH